MAKTILGSNVYYSRDRKSIVLEVTWEGSKTPGRTYIPVEYKGELTQVFNSKSSTKNITLEDQNNGYLRIIENGNQYGCLVSIAVFDKLKEQFLSLISKSTSAPKSSNQSAGNGAAVVEELQEIKELLTEIYKKMKTDTTLSQPTSEIDDIQGIQGILEFDNE